MDKLNNGDRLLAFVGRLGNERFGDVKYDPVKDGKDKEAWIREGGEWACLPCAKKSHGITLCGPSDRIINYCRRDPHCWKCLTPRV
jgi:hypothetical protein